MFDHRLQRSLPARCRHQPLLAAVASPCVGATSQDVTDPAQVTSAFVQLPSTACRQVHRPSRRTSRRSLVGNNQDHKKNKKKTRKKGGGKVRKTHPYRRKPLRQHYRLGNPCGDAADASTHRRLMPTRTAPAGPVAKTRATTYAPLSPTRRGQRHVRRTNDKTLAAHDPSPQLDIVSTQRCCSSSDRRHCGRSSHVRKPEHYDPHRRESITTTPGLVSRRQSKLFTQRQWSHNGAVQARRPARARRTRRSRTQSSSFDKQSERSLTPTTPTRTHRRCRRPHRQHRQPQPCGRASSAVSCELRPEGAVPAARAESTRPAPSSGLNVLAALTNA